MSEKTAETMSAKAERPLSPHLQVYRLPVTAKMSILHRMTGVALAYGVVMVVWMLMAAATGPEAYGVFIDFCRSPLGLFMLFGWSFSLYYHSVNGIRHLFWDMGYLFKIQNAERAGYVVLLATAALTALTWWHVLA